eukprot:Selendium_serpulae@DN2137_c0_g1_i1.p1
MASNQTKMKMRCYIVTLGILVCLMGKQSCVSADRTSVTNNTSLKLALNAALMSDQVMTEALTLMHAQGFHHRISTFCNSEANYHFPQEPLSEGDGLRAVLDTEQLLISGMEADWGTDGDYTVDPPQGFWPDYLRLVVTALNAEYKKNIQIVWMYDQVSEVGGSVPATVDSSDIFFLLNGLVQGIDSSTTRAAYYDVTCPAAVVDNNAITRTSDNIPDFGVLLLKLGSLPAANQTMGVVSEANRDVVIGAFPPTVTWHIFNGDEELATSVADGTVYAGMTTGKLDELLVKYDLTALPSGLPSYFGFLIRHKSAAAHHKLLVPFLVSLITIPLIFM